MIVIINWEKVLSMWQQKLWPSRQSPIETHSAMIYGGGYDMRNFDCQVIFLGWMIDNEIHGINSIHGCGDGSWRTRGLWVDSSYRGRGGGSNLLAESVKLAKINGATFLWSYPRQTSWKTYKKVGFKIQRQYNTWQSSETSDANTYCIHYLKI